MQPDINEITTPTNSAPPLSEQLVHSAHLHLLNRSNLMSEFKQARGLELATIQQFQLGYYAHLPLLGGADGWTIPVRDRDGNLIAMRTRSRKGTGGNRYRPWAQGMKPAPFYALRDDTTSRIPRAVVVCFGEYDAIMLWQQGYSAIGVPGISIMREAWLAEISQQFDVVYVLPDNQWSEIEAAARLVTVANQQWQTVSDEAGNLHRPPDGGPRWRLVCWPHQVVEGDEPSDHSALYRAVLPAQFGPQVLLWVTHFGEKSDATDWFISGHSASDFDTLLRDADNESYAERVRYLQGVKNEAEATPKEAGKVSERPSYLSPKGRWLYPIAELAQRPPLQWLVDGELMEGTLACLIGSPGVGKSFLALDYAMRVVQGGPVVYLAAERAQSFPSRITAWLQHHGGSADNLFICPHPLNLLNPGEVAEFAAEFKCYNPRLLVVDTLARCMVGADENSAQAMGLAIHHLRELQEATRTAVLVVHHLNKSGRAERGSGALRGAADTIILVRKNEYEDLIISCDKQADAVEFATRYASKVAVADSCVIVTKGEGSSKATEQPLLPSPRTQKRTDYRRQLLRALADEEVRNEGLTIKSLALVTNVPEGSIYRLINQMYDADVVEKQPAGIYTITLKGMLELGEPPTSEEQN